LRPLFEQIDQLTEVADALREAIQAIIARAAELANHGRGVRRQHCARSPPRQRRRDLAAKLHAAGCSCKWIGEQIGVTAQAVEGFVKYCQRRENRGGVSTTS
jgi:hypothetical protein